MKEVATAANMVFDGGVARTKVEGRWVEVE